MCAFSLPRSGLTAQERKEADAEQHYEWVMAERAYGDYSREFYEALVRNARHRAIYRILGAGQREVVKRMREYFPELIDEYNKNARAYAGSYTWIVPERDAQLAEVDADADDEDSSSSSSSSSSAKKKTKQGAAEPTRSAPSRQAKQAVSAKASEKASASTNK